MRWLLHGDLDDSVATALLDEGQDVVSSSDAGLTPEASPEAVLEVTRRGQHEIVTRATTLARHAAEVGFAGGTRVLVHLLGDVRMTEQGEAIRRFLARYPRPRPGQLYAVSPTRVKSRQMARGKVS